MLFLALGAALRAAVLAADFTEFLEALALVTGFLAVVALVAVVFFAAVDFVEAALVVATFLAAVALLAAALVVAGFLAAVALVEAALVAGFLAAVALVEAALVAGFLAAVALVEDALAFALVTGFLDCFAGLSELLFVLVSCLMPKSSQQISRSEKWIVLSGKI